MKLSKEVKSQAEYDRFVDLMARMFLKYGETYRKITPEDIIKIFPEHQCGKTLIMRGFLASYINGSNRYIGFP